MTGHAYIPRRIGVALLIGLLGLAVAAAPASARTKRVSAVNVAKTVNAPIPDAVLAPGTPFPQFGLLTSTIEVGKKFKGRKVRDVNVTVQVQGTSGTEPVENLEATLTSPSGATSRLFSFLQAPAGAPNRSLGLLTLDDEARLNLGDGNPVNPTRLYAPWGGPATPETPLATMDNGGVRGTWTLAIQDISPTQTSNLVSWRLYVRGGKPFQTK